MSSTKLSIMNAALVRLGESPITSISEGTAASIAIDAMWEISRAACLRDHPWNFAMHEVQLNSPVYDEVLPNPYIPSDYRYVFTLPSDFIRLIRVFGTAQYKVQGRTILSNNPQCRIRYVRDVLDETEFNPNFADVLASRLASDVGFAITHSQSTADSNYQIYQQKLKSARAIDATEDTTDQLGGDWSNLIASRF